MHNPSIKILGVADYALRPFYSGHSAAPGHGGAADRAAVGLPVVRGLGRGERLKI